MSSHTKVIDEKAKVIESLLADRTSALFTQDYNKVNQLQSDITALTNELVCYLLKNLLDQEELEFQFSICQRIGKFTGSLSTVDRPILDLLLKRLQSLALSQLSNHNEY